MSASTPNGGGESRRGGSETVAMGPSLAERLSAGPTKGPAVTPPPAATREPLNSEPLSRSYSYDRAGSSTLDTSRNVPLSPAMLSSHSRLPGASIAYNRFESPSAYNNPINPSVSSPTAWSSDLSTGVISSWKNAPSGPIANPTSPSRYNLASTVPTRTSMDLYGSPRHSSPSRYSGIGSPSYTPRSPDSMPATYASRFGSDDRSYSPTRLSRLSQYDNFSPSSSSVPRHSSPSGYRSPTRDLDPRLARPIADTYSSPIHRSASPPRGHFASATSPGGSPSALPRASSPYRAATDHIPPTAGLPDLDRVYKTIWVGSMDALKVDILRARGIRYIINTAFEVETAYRHEVDWDELRAAGIENYQIRWDDHLEQRIYPSAELDHGVDLLSRLVADGVGVLVNCSMGKSRSVSLTIAYLMADEGYSFDEALRMCKAARPKANPNPNFQAQLRELEAAIRRNLEKSQRAGIPNRGANTTLGSRPASYPTDDGRILGSRTSFGLAGSSTTPTSPRHNVKPLDDPSPFGSALFPLLSPTSPHRSGLASGGYLSPRHEEALGFSPSRGLESPRSPMHYPGSPRYDPLSSRLSRPLNSNW
eukprot:NODE_1007_length_1944_cov_39.734212_g956_i0.p1 GENE.NODE_1007_length_1944_cov_39.734212_g956_i0~~NODE_1007_length_1944_cov_39.734212_g956_i0.p1  ORF type:complete len:602 (-),score=75.29 NODE_1007_length_1944_cov_39.734212_g956_i0:138-1913(-)